MHLPKSRHRKDYNLNQRSSVIFVLIIANLMTILPQKGRNVPSSDVRFIKNLLNAFAKQLLNHWNALVNQFENTFKSIQKDTPKI